MTHVRMIGGNQDRAWLNHGEAAALTISRAKAFIAADKFEEARQLLEPLIAQGNAEAQYLGACFSWDRETEEQFDQRYISLVTKSAAQNFPPALYVLGYLFDTGDLVKQDERRAAELFMRAANGKHAHSQWLHGLNLLYGSHGVPKSEVEGLKLIREAADAKHVGALETLAQFFERGEFGMPRDSEAAASLRKRAADPDAISY